MLLRYRHVDSLGENKLIWIEKKTPPKYELYGQM